MEEFVKNAQLFWETVDTEKFQPIIHGPEITEEEQAERDALSVQIGEKIRQYNEYKKNQEEGGGQDRLEIESGVRDEEDEIKLEEE